MISFFGLIIRRAVRLLWAALPFLCSQDWLLFVGVGAAMHGCFFFFFFWPKSHWGWVGMGNFAA